MKEDVILERTSTDVHFQTPGFYTLGTDELHGTDFATTHWFNMGKQDSIVKCSGSGIRMILSTR